MSYNTTLPHLNTSSIMQKVRPPPITPPRRFRVEGLDCIAPPNVYDLYPPALLKDVGVPTRVNPVNPAPPDRRTISLETGAAHWQNRCRTELMHRREHYRYHTAWSRYYYGNPSEQELYRRDIRECLKQQMAENQSNKKQQFANKTRESEMAVENDRNDVMKDITSLRNRRVMLTQYRDANKKMMEDNASRRRQMSSTERSLEKEILQYNPINWSQSLK